jgi:hypothetical protein
MANKRGRQMRDFVVTYSTKKNKSYEAVFTGKRDCAVALRLLSWFSSISLNGDKITSTKTVIVDRAKTVKPDELGELANEVVK